MASQKDTQGISSRRGSTTRGLSSLTTTSATTSTDHRSLTCPRRSLTSPRLSLTSPRHSLTMALGLGSGWGSGPGSPCLIMCEDYSTGEVACLAGGDARYDDDVFLQHRPPRPRSKVRMLFQFYFNIHVKWWNKVASLYVPATSMKLVLLARLCYWYTPIIRSG